MTMIIIATAFMNTFTTNVNIKPITKSFKYVGDIAPLGYFDPLGLANEKNSQYLREFELQHGRVAMIAATMIPLYEYMNPGKLGTSFLSDMDIANQLPFWYVMGLLEFARLKTGWENPFVNGSAFTLKNDFQPGNYFNFDIEKVSDRALNSEISNGRLAMLASAHILGSEFVTGHGVF